MDRLNGKCRREEAPSVQQAMDRRGRTDEDMHTSQARREADSRAGKELELRARPAEACAVQYEGPPDDGETEAQYERRPQRLRGRSAPGVGVRGGRGCVNPNALDEPTRRQRRRRPVPCVRHPLQSEEGAMRAWGGEQKIIS